MKEYKTLRVAPNDVDSEAECQGIFGWKLESTQEVYNESQQITGLVGQSVSSGSGNVDYDGILHSGGSSSTALGVQSRTNVTHYVAMRFSRETTMPNYERLNQLEQEYEKAYKEYNICCKSYRYSEPPRKLMTFAVVALILGIILTAVCALLQSFMFMIIGIIAIVAAIVSFIISGVLSKKHKKEDAEFNAKNEKRKQEILSKAGVIYNQAKAIMEGQS